MPQREVLLYPDRRLKEAAAPVEGALIDETAGDLIDTMRSHPRCVGLSAPQIGVPRRIIAFDVSGHPKAEMSHGVVVIANPEFTSMAGSEMGREGCLSLPDITANVRRAITVTVRGITYEGAPVEIETTGFEARVIQHEVDHLDGILILDRVASPSEIFPRTKPGRQ